MNYYSDNESLKFYLQHPDIEKIATLRENNFEEAGQYPDAPANAAETVEGYQQAMDLIGEITAEVIAPNAAQVDAEGPKVVDGRVVYAPGTAQNHQTLTQSGLYGIKQRRKYHGLNMPGTVTTMAGEVVARADVGFATIWMLQDCADTIEDFASEEIKDKFLPRIYQGATCSMDLTEPDAGSDLQSVRLKATYDEAAKCWRLNGVKRFITNGDADIHLVLARSEEGTTDGRGLSYFVYDRNDGGLTVRRIEHKMGIIGSPTAELVFTNAPCQLVGERRLGLIKYTMSLMNGARLGVGAQAVGLCEAACREAVEYAATREQFGKTIDKMIPVQDILHTMRAKTDAVRSLLYETARQVDLANCYERLSRIRPLTGEERQAMKAHLRNADCLTPITKLMASEYSNQCAYDCIQIHGGSGFMKEYTCERLYRDARILSIYEGTSQLQVVAATKGISNGNYLKRIADYDAMPVSAELEPLREVLRQMTADYQTMHTQLTADGAGEAFEHNVRALAESLAYIIMGYLLLLDAERDRRFLDSCRCIIRLGRSEMAKHQCEISCNI